MALRREIIGPHVHIHGLSAVWDILLFKNLELCCRIGTWGAAGFFISSLLGGDCLGQTGYRIGRKAREGKGQGRGRDSPMQKLEQAGGMNTDDVHNHVCIDVFE